MSIARATDRLILMSRYLFKRFSAAIPTLFIIITAAFFLIHAAPGGPFDQEQSLAPEIVANLDATFGLNQPLSVQYVRYMVALAHGDFGPSFKYKDYSVTELVVQGLPVTFTLGSIAMLVALSFGVLMGVFAALRHNTAADQVTMLLAVIGIAVPSFVLLPFMGLVFGIYLHWLPVAGWESGSITHLILPVIALALPPMSAIARLTRGSMLEILRTPYVRTAIAKGLPWHLVIFRHALKPALVPVVGFLAPAVASILTGSLVVESIAGLPGIGRYLVQGALNRDYTLVLGMVILYSTVLILMGLVVDLLYAWLDPRVRLG